MLQGYRDAFDNFSTLQDLLALSAKADKTKLFPLYAYPAYVWGCLKGVSALGSHDPAVATRAADVLQCLLAIMLYYCQPTLFARALSVPIRNSTMEADEGLKTFTSDLLAAVPPDTQVMLAGLRYRILVGIATLIAYVVLCGTALVLCLIVLLLGSHSRFAGRVPKIDHFPIWDVLIHCELDSRSGTSAEGLANAHGSELVRETGNMTVRLAEPI